MCTILQCGLVASCIAIDYNIGPLASILHDTQEVARACPCLSAYTEAVGMSNA